LATISIARQGQAQLSVETLCKARLLYFHPIGKARLGKARLSKARLGKARLGKASGGNASKGYASLD
jgi:hypothetical protein